MQRRMLSVLAALAAALPFATQAGTMDYSYVELGYQETELEDVDGDGFALRGSLAFHENIFGFAGYQDLSFDNDADLSLLQVGVGGRIPLNPKVDLVGTIAFGKGEVEVGPFDEDEDGFILGGKLRGAVTESFELEGGVEHIDLGDFFDDTLMVVEGRYFFVENFSGGLRLEFGDADSIGIAGRFTF